MTITITVNDLPAILEQHRLWRCSRGGTQADLRDVNLSGVELRYTNLSRANLSWANLSRANLSGANLSCADLSRANLYDADLSRANLSCANLSCADLSRTNLIGANLIGADLIGADLGGGQVVTLNPLFFTGATWPVMVTDKHIKIGFRVYTTNEWAGFDDRAIAAMCGRSALTFWGLWKDTILTMAKVHQSRVKENQQ